MAEIREKRSMHSLKTPTRETTLMANPVGSIFPLIEEIYSMEGVWKAFKICW